MGVNIEHIPQIYQLLIMTMALPFIAFKYCINYTLQVYLLVLGVKIGVKMNLYSFWRGLTAEQRKSFCRKAGIGYRYMDNHLVHRTKNPSIKTVDAMVKASNDALSHEDVIGFFMQESAGKNA